MRIAHIIILISTLPKIQMKKYDEIESDFVNGDYLKWLKNRV